MLGSKLSEDRTNRGKWLKKSMDSLKEEESFRQTVVEMLDNICKKLEDIEKALKK